LELLPEEQLLFQVLKQLVVELIFVEIDFFELNQRK
jgi:hypothetical protein